MPDQPSVAPVVTWRWVADFFVEVFAESAISNSDWGRLLADLEQGRARLKGVLVSTKGATPSAAQRLELRKILEQGAPVPAAILSESPMVRMALFALNLFLENEARPRPFAPGQIDDALAHLKAPRELWPQFRQAIAEMQRALGIEGVTR